MTFMHIENISPGPMTLGSSEFVTTVNKDWEEGKHKLVLQHWMGVRDLLVDRDKYKLLEKDPQKLMSFVHQSIDALGVEQVVNLAKILPTMMNSLQSLARKTLSPIDSIKKMLEVGSWMHIVGDNRRVRQHVEAFGLTPQYAWEKGLFLSRLARMTGDREISNLSYQVWMELVNKYADTEATEIPSIVKLAEVMSGQVNPSYNRVQVREHFATLTEQYKDMELPHKQAAGSWQAAWSYFKFDKNGYVQAKNYLMNKGGANFDETRTDEVITSSKRGYGLDLLHMVGGGALYYLICEKRGR